jgi:hypothetical protein
MSLLKTAVFFPLLTLLALLTYQKLFIKFLGFF